MRALLLASMVAVVVESAQSAAAQTPAEPVELSLDDAVARGLEVSHRLAEVVARGDAATSVVEQRHAAGRPRVSLQGGYTRTNHIDPFGVPLPNNQLRIIYPDIPDNSRTRLDAQWPVYTGGRVQALEQAASSTATAVRHEASAARTDLRLDIARAYWNLVAARETLRVLDEALRRADAHVRDARNRLEAGLAQPNDVSSAEAQRARQRLLRVQAGGAHDVAQAALARLVGLPPEASIVPTSALESEAGATTAAPERVEALVDAARAERADRQATAEQVKAAERRQEAATALRRPTVAVAAGVDLARPNPRIFPRESAWRESWDVGVLVDWSLFDGGRTRGEIAEAAAARRAAEARLREMDSLLALEIRQRLRELESNVAAVTAADEAVAAAAEARRVVANRFEAGVATATDVLDAQLTLLQAELDRTQALAARRIAGAALARARGRPAEARP